VPMGLAGIFGTFCVLAVNAWMNDPTGFRIVGGEVVDVNPWAAMFNDQVWLQFLHMWIAAFMVAGFVISAVYAAGMLRGRLDRHHRLGFTVPFTFASVAAVLQPFVGHLLGLRVAETQPAKLAAFELATTTESPSPLRLGGLLIDGEVRWAIDIPRLGSIISRNSFTEPVQGLDTIPADQRPPVNITHVAFQSMVAIGTLLALAALFYWVARWRGRDLLGNRWFLRFVVLAGPLAVIAVELGWIATEVGRQPWVVYGIMRTAEAATENPGLWWLLGSTLVVYSALTVGAVQVLRSMARRWRAGEEDLPSPYGPELADAPRTARGAER
jgi:cytochrome d ubiquinol oxidase subunit I